MHDGSGAAEDGLAAVDELTHLLLDELSPIVAAHRRAVARRVGLHPDDLVCLDLLHRLGPLPAATLAERIGVTRSAISKIVRRLEAGGHVERRLREGQRQGIEVAWRSHARRDAALAALRDQLRRDVAELVVDHRLADPERLGLVAGSVVRLQTAVYRQTRELTDAAADADLLERRRRARDAAPDPWRGR